MDPYARLGGSLGASLLVMYMLAFSQMDVLAHLDWSLSVFWISLTMVAAMGLIMLGAMWSMFPDRRWNLGLALGFGALLVLGIVASRTELLVGDDAFLRSMIPHHSRAIHMCQEADLTDPEILDLCQQIIETQRDEIEQMEAIMARR